AARSPPHDWRSAAWRTSRGESRRSRARWPAGRPRWPPTAPLRSWHCKARWAAATTTSRSSSRNARCAARSHTRRKELEAMTGLIGRPINRIDGPLKVSGRATYAAEYWDSGEPLYGWIVGATIGKGRVADIDTTRAEQAPGVRHVMTHRNAPAQGEADPAVRPHHRAFPVLSGAGVHHYREPPAL